MNGELLKERLKEAFGSDTQQTIAEKLNTTQGNVSKMLLGTRQPTLETVFLVAEVYDVSVDWLLGLTDRKRPSAGVTYGSAMENLLALEKCGAISMTETEDKKFEAVLKDPLLCALLAKAEDLAAADRDSYCRWIETRLPLFEDRCLISYTCWGGDRDIRKGVHSAATDSEWLKVHDLAKKAHEEREAWLASDPYGERILT